MTTPDATAAVASELAHLRTDIGRVGGDVGDIKTSCAVLVERSNRHEQDMRDLRKDMEEELRKIREEEIKPLRADVEAEKSRRWPLPSLAALVAVAGLVLTLWQLATR